MKKFQMRALSATALLSGVALTTIGLPTTAFAQDAPGVSGDGAEAGDIIVTARKRDEDIQTVPISITAYTAEDLAERNISNLNDLTNSTPGVAITSIAGGNVLNVYLRGLAPANTANDLNVESNVGVFIDGIYQTSRNTLDIISVLDVGQIEVAKGPQSALFGRSTFAGALAISTKRPAREFEGNIQATVGEDEDYRIRGTISAPLGGGLYARVGGGYLTYDGYGKNAADPKNNLGGVEKYAVTGSLEYAPHDDLTVRLSGFFTRSESELTPAYVLPLTSLNCGTTFPPPNSTPSLRCGALPPQKVSDLSVGVPDTTAKTRQVSLDINWNLDGVSIVSVTGYTAAEQVSYNDFDGTSAGRLYGVCDITNAVNPSCGSNFFPAPYTRLVRTNSISSAREKVRTFSQELRLQSANESPFQWLFGGSFFDSRVPIQTPAGSIGTDQAGLTANERLIQVTQVATPAPTGTGPSDFTSGFLVPDSRFTQRFGSYAAARTQTMSIFGSLGYAFGNLRVAAEGRYNVDRKRSQTFSNFTNPVINGTDVPPAGAYPIAGALFKRTFNSFSPRFTVDYQATPDIFLYGTAAKGVRSGGFNAAAVQSLGCTTCILASEVAYDEESNWTYELGFKSKLFGQRLLLNASAFYTDWKGVQITSFTENSAATTPPAIVRNAGNLKSKGFEVQADLDITDMFGFGGSVIYSDPEFERGAFDTSQTARCVIGGGVPATATAAPGCPPVIVVTTPSGAVRAVPSLEGKRPARSVKWQWNLHATANIPLSEDWKVVGRVDVNHTGLAFNNLINTASFGRRTLTSGRIGVENERYSIAIFGNNIFDKTYTSNSIAQPRTAFPFFSSPEIYLGEGRRLGVTGTVKF